MNLKDYDKAIQVYQEYLRNFPQGRKSDLTAYVIAKCLAGKSDIPGAIETLQTALAENPDMEYADDYRRILAQLQEGGE